LELFTGIIETTGKVRELMVRHQGAALVIDAAAMAPGLKIGESVAVSGVCLTVIQSDPPAFSCELSEETLARTTLGLVRPGMVVNLERPLLAGSRLGGHFVLGHVDGIGRLLSAVPSGDGVVMAFTFPPDLGKYLVYKGSVAVDGISLTVASLEQDSFTVAVVPFTLRETNLGRLMQGDAANIETDILGKYLERFTSLGVNIRGSSKLTMEYLKEQGF